MLKNFSQRISARLLLSYSVPLLCLAMLGLSGYSSAKRTFAIETERDLLNKASYAADNATYHLIDSIRKAESGILNARLDEQLRYLTMYQATYAQFLQSFEELNALVEQHRNLETHVQAEDQADEQEHADELETLIENLETEGLRINAVVEKIFAQLKANNVSGAVALAAELEADNVDISRANLLSHLTDDLDENTEAFVSAQSHLTDTLMWGTAIASLITIALGGLLTQQIRRQMNRIVGVVEQNGIQVTTSSTQIAASSRQLEASVTEQVASTTQITATATEIAATAEALTHTIERVSGLSEAAAETASSGKQDLERMAATIQQLIAATATISSKLGLIDDKANNISTVVAAITKVADQTNLLSLNAAIEAEKAGEYGAGFSVVAREIRRLADQTAIATLDIENMMQEMLSSVSSGVMEMDKFTQEVSNNADSITQISQQMAQIIYQVQSLVPQFETVSDGMLAQAQGAQQIKAAMEQLNDTSQQTAESVKDTNQVILQLGDVAQDLQTEVAHFRLAV